MKQHNFSAGPSILPIPVLQKASEAVLDLNQTGLSILEISHRSPNFINIINEARALTKEILNIPDSSDASILNGQYTVTTISTDLKTIRLNIYLYVRFHQHHNMLVFFKKVNNMV